MEKQQQTQSEPITAADWLTTEMQSFQGDTTVRLPGLKFEENKITEITVDFSKPFDKWQGQNANGTDVTKAKIPIIHLSENKIWWLNVFNPIYREIITAGKSGQSTFKILQTGTQDKTKYVMVK